MRHLIFLVLLYTMSGMSSTAQSPPFQRGVNLTNWFQADLPGAIHFGKYSKVDFENIASLGCDVIRLPIKLNAMTSGAPDYTLDALFLGFLDSAVAWAEDLDLHLILDNHTFDPSDKTEPSIEDPLVKVCGQMAQYYHGGFGIFNKGKQGLFDHNLNAGLLEQLGLHVPAQTPYEMKPDTTGFILYDDYIHSILTESSNGEGIINYYSSRTPNYGKYYIEWSDIDRFEIATEDQSFPGDTIWFDQVVITNQDTASVITSAPLSVFNTAGIHLYPNPSSSLIAVDVDQTSGPYEIKIYSVQGVLLYEAIFRQSPHWIDTSTWPHGLYDVTLMGDGRSYHAERFVKN